MAHEEVLAGGNSSVVVRVGDTVRRNSGPWTPAVHGLLAALHDGGVKGVPVALGLDERGREMLTFVSGDVVQYPLPAWIWHEAVLRDASRLLRQIHDAAAHLASADQTWQLASHEPVEVVCHNDFAPYNMVFQDGRLAGAIDFDAASPGPRIWDVAYLAYQLVPLIEGTGPGEPPEEEKRARLDGIIAAYGQPFAHADIFESLGHRLLELADYSDRRAAEAGRAELRNHADRYRKDSARMFGLAVEQGSAAVADVTCPDGKLPPRS